MIPQWGVTVPHWGIKVLRQGITTPHWGIKVLRRGIVIPQWGITSLSFSTPLSEVRILMQRFDLRCDGLDARLEFVQGFEDFERVADVVEGRGDLHALYQVADFDE